MTETAAGPSRTKRAADNYLKNPASYGGKLLEARVLAARNALVEVSVARDNWDDAPAAFLKNRAPWSGPPEWVPDHYACSIFCAAFNASRVFSHTVCGTVPKTEYGRTVDAVNALDIKQDLLVEVLTDTYDWSSDKYRQHTKVEIGRTPALSARCFVCGVTIGSDGTLSGDKLVNVAQVVPPGLGVNEMPEDFTEGTTPYAVDGDGEIINLKKIRVVRLTDREAELFTASTPDVRRAFAQKHGIPLGL